MADTSHMTLELGLNPFAIDPSDLRSWERLQRDAASCDRCALSNFRTRGVVGEGPREARLFLIGDAPGRHEDLQGRPFRGAVGNLLDSCLRDAGLQREDVFLTNLVKCLPPKKRLPIREEVDCCSGFLIEQLAHVRPDVVVTLGQFTTDVLLGRQVPLARIAGYRFDLYGATLIPTYHPSDAIRGNPHAVATIQRDLRVAAGILDGRVPSAARTITSQRAAQGSSA